MSAPRRPASGRTGRRRADPARRVAYDGLRAVHAGGAYSNLVLSDLLAERRLDARDAAFATELLNGTCRLEGTYDAILARAGGRPTSSFQPAVLDVLRLGCHQLLSMRVPTHAAVAATVDLGAVVVGERITGVVNAVLRKVAARDLDGWVDELARDLSGVEELAVRHHHPVWVAQAYADVLGSVEASQSLDGNNTPPLTSLVVRPGLATVPELLAAGAEPGEWSPYAARVTGNPADLVAVKEGRAGVQDEGSQLVALALSRVEGPAGPWLDLCAGPGGKAALLAGLAAAQGQALVASERQPHRAELVAQALRGYAATDRPPVVITADGTQPAWRPGAFAKVLADVPCTGIGALRRRPDSRWRQRQDDLPDLVSLQQRLLHVALDSVVAGGVVAYVTCSPHLDETEGVVRTVMNGRDDVEVIEAAPYLPWVTGAERGSYAQLWPHRHRTDAMFLALLRRR